MPLPLNRFEQAEDSDDNELILDGTVEGSTIDEVRLWELATYYVDVSTDGTAFVFPGFAGTVSSIALITSGTIDSGTANITPQIDGINIGVPAASFGVGPPGQEVVLIPTSANTFTDDVVIGISFDGNTVGDVPVHILLKVSKAEV